MATVTYSAVAGTAWWTALPFGSGGVKWEGTPWVPAAPILSNLSIQPTSGSSLGGD